MACFPYPFIVWRPCSGNLLEFLGETYPAKTRRMELRNGENFMILTSTAFTDSLCGGRTGDRSALSMLPRELISRWLTRHFDYNGLLEISEIFIVSVVFFPLRSVFNAPQTPYLVGEGTATLPHPFLPLWRRAFEWGPDVVECVGPTRWLIRPCCQDYIVM